MGTPFYLINEYLQNVNRESYGRGGVVNQKINILGETEKVNAS